MNSSCSSKHPWERSKSRPRVWCRSAHYIYAGHDGIRHL